MEKKLCEKCGTETVKAYLRLSDIWCPRGKSIFEGDAQSPVICCVCPQCGKIEMYAQHPERFKGIKQDD